MKKRRRLLSVVVVLVIGLAALVGPASVAAADDGGTMTDGGLTFAIPGILSLMGLPGDQGAAITLDLANLNATATLEGMGFGPRGFDWKAVTVAQKVPAGMQGVTISDAKASIAGPSTGFSTDASAHLEVRPSDALQAQATVGLTYNGLTRQTYVAVSDVGFAVDTPAVGVELANLSNLGGAVTADSAQLAFPAAGATTTLSGVNISPRGLDFDALTVQQRGLMAGQAAALRDLQLVIRGPSGAYATEGSVVVQLNAGGLAQAEAKISLMYEPTTGKFVANVSEGSAWLRTEALTVELSGITYSGSTLQIEKIALAVPPARLSGEISGIVVGGGGIAFQEAWLRYTPDPAAGGAFSGLAFGVENVEGAYVFTTQATIKPAVQQ